MLINCDSLGSWERFKEWIWEHNWQIVLESGLLENDFTVCSEKDFKHIIGTLVVAFRIIVAFKN